MSEDNDLFDDVAGTQQAEGDSPTFAKNEEVEQPKVDPTKETESGDKEVETPSTEEGSEEAPEKFIPEHRFKAALKDVTEGRDTALKRLEEAEAKLAELTAKPAPNREEDPDGYDLHVRIETSKRIMSEAYPDYNEVIAHYQEMVADNPYLNEAVAKHPAPAQHAYNIAKKDMEIKELMDLKTSEDWKEFQEFKKHKAEKQTSVESTEKALVQKESPVKVPNLNRVAAATTLKGSKNQETDDDLFVGAL